MNKLDQIYSEARLQKNSGAEYAKRYCNYLAELLGQLDYTAIEAFATQLLEARKSGKKIYFIGNGGSAATATHFANDLQIGPTPHTNSSFKAVALTDNNAIITCIANDFGYDEIFRRQLSVLLEPGDIVVAISASGNSPNIISAIDYCKQKGNFVIGISGFDGGLLKQKSDLSINIVTQKGEYGPVEDLHMVLDHLVSTFLIRKVKDLS